MLWWALSLTLASTPALELPEAAARAVTAKYRDWTLAPSTPGLEAWFAGTFAPWRPNLLRGDFNSDGAPDFAVQILAGGRQRAVVLLGNTNGFRVIELAAQAPDPLTFLIIYRKGEKDFDFESMKPFRYAADSIGLLYSKQTAVTFTWRGNGFRKRLAPNDDELDPK